MAMMKGDRRLASGGWRAAQRRLALQAGGGLRSEGQPDAVDARGLIQRIEVQRLLPASLRALLFDEAAAA
ncbi:MAG: hypothetical protein JF606_26425 [Burkholderiales bacterium]|nr:hypothetical protein [Burkholderiales bacterium]